MQKNEIVMIHGTDYFNMTLQLLQAADLRSVIGSKTARIALKPNIVFEDKAENGAVTHPEIVEQLPSVLGATAMTILIIVAGTAASIVRIYAGISIGHQFNSHRILFSILALVAFNIIETILSWILGSLGYYSGIFESLSRIFEADTLQGLYLAQAGMIVFSLGQLAIFGLLTWVLLDRKLNLE